MGLKEPFGMPGMESGKQMPYPLVLSLNVSRRLCVQVFNRETFDMMVITKRVASIFMGLGLQRQQHISKDCRITGEGKLEAGTRTAEEIIL